MGTEADKKINIKGLVCPYTFVKSKLAIEGMEAGQVLEIILDYPSAATNVPRSMEDQGHKVLRTEKINDTDWLILVQKGRERE
jgi:TusA-related sulfurtransferase